MPSPEHCFTRFTADISQVELPTQFTFPFYYTPHPLSVLAAKQLQQYLLKQKDFCHDFGLNGTTEGRGKMFGVLVVQNQQGEVGFLSAFSGKIAEQNLLPGFVSPVFDMLQDESFFHEENNAINKINAQYRDLVSQSDIADLQADIRADRMVYQQEETEYRNLIIANRAKRKHQRELGLNTLPNDQLNQLLEHLAKQSVAEKNTLKYMKKSWDDKLAVKEARLAELESQRESLKAQRKALSNALQEKLHKQYRFLNQLGKERNLIDIFTPTNNPVPPAGAGECAAPKLLQFAFQYGFKPLAMAEFWWGTPPKSEVRQHKAFYPSCQSKCQPILSHMLQGLNVEPNPLAISWAQEKELEILFQDDAMVVVNKPSGLLSVPGKTIKDSAYTRLQERFPDAEGPFVIHRLDMATSGILVFALTKRANKSLQKQFITREVQKRYIAILEGTLDKTEGLITLPMRGDPDDRPRQLICHQFGKPAETKWQLISVTEGRSRVRLYPKTGRTHQLRLHCAHHLGLNMPIRGDGLYGEKADRLYLHAERLELYHPYTRQPMHFTANCEF
ncbi:RNA pseudouridine synthase [Vibrio azureus]|uniref:Pseudouridine synthase RsuA/RluA-like domain-containing protein n=1 Tax=Vibrio azureus NBRC 104587 TaxID=1219077 RepID=U3AVN2_9VIBR|nr:RluA family pseudouridine synthase [Vibrio azureus]AUI87473.1 RNA pseudouridine synthase [Vibrio azureus]GAD77287.1 hypothetical protein VAZ01S_069_00350 [Vibrio azureus NBRC 104587]